MGSLLELSTDPNDVSHLHRCLGEQLRKACLPNMTVCHRIAQVLYAARGVEFRLVESWVKEGGELACARQC